MPDQLDLAAWELPPVSLDELNAEAALQTRHDRKYLLNANEALHLLRWIASDERIDNPRVVEHLWLRSHNYASTYFDTSSLQCYRMGLQRSPHRFKVRSRTYVDSAVTFLSEAHPGWDTCRNIIDGARRQFGGT
ncbi:VTC domain-containing protein [Actinomyces minihominis]|uniref:VTC domain-containing protein n=1 Tax=Actinomyces minihominis TaxID=2002838 RepID=UPI000C06BB9F|nr:VTC domain-containing protein [Actinomyces minihominis]